MRKMRSAGATRRQDQIGIAATRWNPNQIRVARLPSIELGVLAVVRIAAQQNDAAAVR